MGIDFTASGTTDGGLSFGGKAGFDTGDETVNTGTVFVSGAFGTITIGDNDAADLLAGGIADVGLNGQGVDEVVEDIRGTTARQFRYDQSVGNIALAISAGTSRGVPGAPNTRNATRTGGNIAPTDSIAEGSFEVKKNSYAVGMSFSASVATVGLGYDSRKTVSAGFGYSTGPISANAFYAKGKKTYRHLGADGRPGILLPGQANQEDGMFDAVFTGLGVDVSYAIGASTLTLAYAKAELSNVQPYWINPATGEIIDHAASTAHFASPSLTGIGIGFSRDLGGGASLVAGLGRVPQIAVGDLGMSEIGQPLDGADVDIFVDPRVDLSRTRNVASVGLSFSF